MSEGDMVPPERVDALHQRLSREAEASGYHLNPDEEFTRDLVEGLLVNEQRYGYRACPCRLASSDKQEDLDIICPCDYRDDDLLDWGACYCALYVSAEMLAGEEEVQPIPERRPPSAQRAQNRPEAASDRRDERPALPLPVWRCRVCGYLCARERPPGACPVCRARQDRFERFW